MNQNLINTHHANANSMNAPAMMMQDQSQGSRFGAHEVIAMTECLNTCAANVELLGMLTQQAQDPRLRDTLSRQAQAIHQHYMQGVHLMNGSGTMASHVPLPSYAMQNTAQPKIGLHNPTTPAPNLNAQQVSDRTIAMTVLNMHKHGAVSGMMFALECVNPQFRGFLVDGALACDKMAYDTWKFENEQGFYQVPQLEDQTMQTMMQAFDSAGATSQPPMM